MATEYTFHRYTEGEAPGDDYVPSRRLAIAVNTALAAEQPLLVTGEPGTGKTELASSVARRLGLGEVLRFVARSDHQARDCLYTFDSLRRLYDAQINDGRARHPGAYVRVEALGEAIASPHPRVVLIDEIDKAPRDFPNDLLGVLDRKLEFTIRETGERVAAPEGVRPIVIITSNREQPLPRPFLRRCVFHHIEFPDEAQLARIVRTKLDPGQISDRMIAAVLKRFGEVRARGLEKPPTTGELISWIRVLLRAGVAEADVLKGKLEDLFPGVLVKLEEDMGLVLGSGAKPAAAGASAR